MADLINFTLPTIDDDTDDKTMKQIKNYLFQLTEQMKFYLNNIDSDNFTQAYAEKLNSMADSSTTNETAITLTRKLLDKYRERFKAELIESANLISGNSGGFIVLRDVNDDGKPDELLIMNAESFENATKYWQWNQNGLMYVDKLNLDSDGNIIPSLAMTMDGKINANCITTGILQGIEIRAAEGTIGGWVIGGWKDKNGNNHEGLKKTFKVNNSYVTFAIDSTSGSTTSNYILQLFESDENGNAIFSEYFFALSIGSDMELNTLNVRTLNFYDDFGWLPISYSNYFQSYSSTDTVRYRKVGNIVEIRGACKPKQSISGSLTEYVIGSIGSSFAPSSTIRVLCQGSGTCCWLLIVKANGQLTFSRYRQTGTYSDVSTSTWLPIHVTYLLD